MSWYKKNPDDAKPSGRYNQCAEFVSRVYRKIDIDLVPGRSDDTTQPQDFLTSPVLIILVGADKVEMWNSGAVCGSSDYHCENASAALQIDGKCGHVG